MVDAGRRNALKCIVYKIVDPNGFYGSLGNIICHRIAKSVELLDGRKDYQIFQRGDALNVLRLRPEAAGILKA